MVYFKCAGVSSLTDPPPPPRGLDAGPRHLSGFPDSPEDHISCSWVGAARKRLLLRSPWLCHQAVGKQVDTVPSLLGHAPKQPGDGHPQNHIQCFHSAKSSKPEHPGTRGAAQRSLMASAGMAVVGWEALAQEHVPHLSARASWPAGRASPQLMAKRVISIHGDNKL